MGTVVGFDASASLGGGGGPLGGAYDEEDAAAGGLGMDGGGPLGGAKLVLGAGGGPARSKCSGPASSGPDDPLERAGDGPRRVEPSSGVVV